MVRNGMLALASVAAIGVLGSYVTARFAGATLASFPEDFSAAQLLEAERYLYSQAAACLDRPAAALMVRKVSLVGMEATASPAPPPMLRWPGPAEGNTLPALSPSPSPIHRHYQFNAEFRTYTFFAIPFGRITVLNNRCTDPRPRRRSPLSSAP